MNQSPLLKLPGVYGMIVMYLSYSPTLAPGSNITVVESGSLAEAVANDLISKNIL
jgi:hypothetical protein